MSWNTMLTDEQRRPELVRRRELSRRSKVQLIDMLIAAEHRLAAEREDGSEPC